MIPRIFDYSLNSDDVYIVMEYYPYTTIHELMIEKELNENQWREIYNSIFFVIDKMKRYKLDTNNEEIRKTLEEMYYYKTINRLSELKKDNRFINYFEKNININGKKYKSLNFYMNNLYEVLYKNNIFDLDALNIIHGDLCFSNILYNMEQKIIRVIDPRGKFGQFDIYGDYRYDLAKISHSISGKYDYIIRDMFDIYESDEELKFKIIEDKNNMIGKTIFYEYVNSDILKQIEIIEALLFLSMITLHADYHKRQLAMMCTGIMLIDKYFQSCKEK